MEEHRVSQPEDMQYADTDHAVRDRELFDQIAEKYCRKDLLPATRHARKHRLFQTGMSRLLLKLSMVSLS